MREKTNNGEEARKKSFFAKAFEKLDKKMEERAKLKPCCSKTDQKDSGTCCG